MGKISTRTKTFAETSLRNLRQSIATMYDVIDQLDAEGSGRREGFGALADAIDMLEKGENLVSNRLKQFIKFNDSVQENKSLKLSRLMREIFPDEHVEHFLDQQFELTNGKDYYLGNGVIQFKNLPKNKDMKAQILRTISAQMNHMNLPSQIDIANNRILYTLPTHGMKEVKAQPITLRCPKCDSSNILNQPMASIYYCLACNYRWTKLRNLTMKEASINSKLSPVMKEKFLSIAGALSPENISWDGERPKSAIARERTRLNAEWRKLEAQVGRKVSEDEVWQQ